MRITNNLFHMFIMLALLFITGCNFMKWGYNYSDWYIFYKIDGYFDLDNMQKDLAKKYIKELHAWHRKNELPQYAVFLSDVGRAVESGLTVDDINKFYAQFDMLRENLIARLIPLVSDLLVKLNGNQIDKFEKELLKENNKIEEKLNLPQEEILVKRIDKVKETYEDWLGSLSRKQTEMIKAFVDSTPDYNSYRLPHRIEKQKLFFTTIRKINTFDSNRKLLREIWINSEKDVKANHIKQRDIYRKENMNFLLKLYESLTDGQKSHLINKINNMAGKFTELQK